jgi:adenylate cyclase
MARRLAAILAADVVGYSRLMAVDEAGTHARLKTLRQDFIEPKITEHHGRIVKLMGDGALVEFGSVVDAVECAAAIQAGVAERQAELPEDQRIAFRIGINIGDIIIDEGDIYGDGVNVAARLETLAEPGEICVSRTVYNHAKANVAFGFEPMGEHRVKNIPEPVTLPAREGARAEAGWHAMAPWGARRSCGDGVNGRWRLGGVAQALGHARKNQSGITSGHSDRAGR